MISKGKLIQIGGIENHVHLLLSLSNIDKFSESIRQIKASSTKWIHQEIKTLPHFAWQERYGSFTIGCSQIDIIKDYIAKQREHHQTRSFEQEYILLLKKNQIDFNEKYLFG